MGIEIPRDEEEGWFSKKSVAQTLRFGDVGRLRKDLQGERSGVEQVIWRRGSTTTLYR